jgi:hypothetical protein
MFTPNQTEKADVLSRVELMPEAFILWHSFFGILQCKPLGRFCRRHGAISQAYSLAKIYNLEALAAKYLANSLNTQTDVEISGTRSAYTNCASGIKWSAIYLKSALHSFFSSSSRHRNRESTSAPSVDSNTRYCERTPIVL